MKIKKESKNVKKEQIVKDISSQIRKERRNQCKKSARIKENEERERNGDEKLDKERL